MTKRALRVLASNTLSLGAAPGLAERVDLDVPARAGVRADGKAVRACPVGNAVGAQRRGGVRGEVPGAEEVSIVRPGDAREREAERVGVEPIADPPAGRNG